MEYLILAVVVASGVVGVGAAWVWITRRPPPEPPPRAWKSDTVTPIMLGPRNKAPERVARNFVVAQGTLLAIHMAHADGEILEVERDAIRSFLVDHVAEADPSVAARALTEAEAHVGDEVALASALEALRAVGSAEQRMLLVDLLVHVAQADGLVKPEEVAFMQRVGRQLGLSDDDVKARISLDG